MCTVSVLSCVCQLFIKEFYDDDDSLCNDRANPCIVFSCGLPSIVLLMKMRSSFNEKFQSTMASCHLQSCFSPILFCTQSRHTLPLPDVIWMHWSLLCFSCSVIAPFLSQVVGGLPRALILWCGSDFWKKRFVANWKHSHCIKVSSW